MHLANPDTPLIPFDTARIIHNTFGVILAIFYTFFFIVNLTSGNWRHYIPQLKGLVGRLIIQTKYYLYGIFRGEPHPYHPTEKMKFNPLQQLTYLNIMYVLVPIIILSGLLLLFPSYIPDKIFGTGGLVAIALLHYVAALFGTLFMVGHIYLATTGETIITDFKEMITGWHELDEKNHA